MKSEWSDEDLTGAFEDLREHDARTAPPFAAVHEAALARGRARRHRSWFPAAAVAAIVLVTLFALRARPAYPPAPPLSQWRSPTAFLLESSGDRLIKTVPSFPTHPPTLGAGDSLPRRS
jgi:hypothetical protein